MLGVQVGESGMSATSAPSVEHCAELKMSGVAVLWCAGPHKRAVELGVMETDKQKGKVDVTGF